MIVLAASAGVTRSADEPSPAAPRQDQPPSLFGAQAVWKIELHFSAEEYAGIQPPPGGFGQPPAAPAQRDPQPAGGPARPRERNLFGTEFPWGHARIVIDGQTFEKAGVRYAGDATYLVSSQGLKRPLRVELDRFADRRFHGIARFDLHAGLADPGRLREALALAMFRACGVPAPRTAFAEVWLTVPGKYSRELLGMYTVVENVDEGFLHDRLDASEGLLMKPTGMRDLQSPGDDQASFKASYRPQRDAAAQELGRVAAFARLISQATDEEFHRQISDYLEVDSFLRFMAANALLSNVESFFALGQNYWLYLHPQTGKFHFLQGGELEFSLANFLLMGSARQLIDLSLTRPYPGDNTLAERLLADPQIAAQYHAIIDELLNGAFTKKRYLHELELLEQATRDALRREAQAVAARREPPPGFGPAGDTAKPPELRAFIDGRLASAAAQRAGRRTGYVPQFSFGPPPGPSGGPAESPQPTDATVASLVPVPPGFEVTLYGAPPRITYPVALSAAPDGTLFIAVDEQGSLGRTPGGGRVMRCTDDNHDGKVDRITVFARMEHPRGVIQAGNSVWVMHPPNLSLYHDDDNDGVADRHELLVTGLTTGLISTRGGDHTTNGIRLAIDGWIYIGVGDYGIHEATGKDGSKVRLRGGGIVRVRPDGTDLEVFATGLRNPFDLAFDPSLNLFTRDNSNDGGGWDVRVFHLPQTSHAGYTQLYANFTEETLPPLGTFGGGSGTGVLWVDAPNWPVEYRDTLYTADWGRGELYRHGLRPRGASFEMSQETFLKIPRPTGVDLDATGQLFVASWRGGEASVYLGPTIGYVVRVVPKGYAPRLLPELRALPLAELVDTLTDSSAKLRLAAQRELLARGNAPPAAAALEALARRAKAPLHGRVAAIFTLKQLQGAAARHLLLDLAADASVREFALRALTDRRGELMGLESGFFVQALADPSPRVRAQALVCLARLQDPAAAAAILPLTSRPEGSALPEKAPVHAQPDADRVLPHLAVRALVSLEAVEACLAALDGPHRAGALLALRCIHQQRAVDGLIRKLGSTIATDARHEILSALIRLYHREADYDGSWWGIRPDNAGPYWDPRTWHMSERIAAVVTSAILDADDATAAALRNELDRHQVVLPGLPPGEPPRGAAPPEPQTAIVIPAADPKNPNQIGNLGYEVAARRALAAAGDAEKGRQLFTTQSCRVCHTDKDGQTPRGPHLVDIGKRYQPAELVESILKPGAKLAQGFETWSFETTEGRVLTGFIVRERAGATIIRQNTGVEVELRKDQIEVRKRQETSSMPEKIVDNLTPEQLADLLAYLRSLE